VVFHSGDENVVTVALTLKQLCGIKCVTFTVFCVFLLISFGTFLSLLKMYLSVVILLAVIVSSLDEWTNSGYVSRWVARTTSDAIVVLLVVWSVVSRASGLLVVVPILVPKKETGLGLWNVPVCLDIFSLMLLSVAVSTTIGVSSCFQIVILHSLCCAH